MRPEILRRLGLFLRRELGMPEEDMEAFAALAEESLGAVFAALKTALEAQDAAGASDAAHGLKGSLRNMGLVDLAESAREMERLAEQGEFAACREKAVAIEDELGLATTTQKDGL